MKKLRVNRGIRASQVRLIDENNKQVGIVKISTALQMAEDAGLELVEISPNVDPPVCKILDYGKYKYRESKKLNAAKKKQHQIQVKEIKMRPSIAENDYQIKLKHAKKFIGQGNKVKFTIRFRGRQMAHPEMGETVLKRFEEDMTDIAIVESKPVMLGRNMTMVIGPRR
ncbi:MAG: translation initiation factor IF-3 [Proteobacteria bacterium]|nr:translation initiation factor IF-3 [Pseudomonadota bacterium]